MKRRNPRFTFCLTLLFALLPFLQPLQAGASTSFLQGGNSSVLPRLISDTAREGTPLIREPAVFGETRGEALKAAYDLLGWGNVLGVLQRIFGSDPVGLLSSGIRPRPPEPFLELPGERVTPEDLPLFLEWVRECRSSMNWDFSLQSGSLELRLHKEGIAAESDAWEVRLEEGLEEPAGLAKLGLLGEAGWPAALRRNPERGVDLLVGPFPSFLDCAKAFAALPRVSGMHMAPSPFAPHAPPLFWAALIGRDGIRAEVRLASEIGKPRAALSELAQAFEAEGGINGGFFSGSVPVGTLVVGGIPLHQSYGDRSAIGLSPGHPPVFGNGSVVLQAETEERSFRVDRLNEPPRNGEVSLFFEGLPFQDPAGPKSEDVRGIPVSVQLEGNLSVPPINGFLVESTRSTQFPRIAPGSRLRLRVLWSDPVFEGVPLVIQAGPAIIRSGLVNGAAESFREETRLEKHPRSLVGWDGSSLWWIVVDGRNPFHSLGLTLEEAAGFALSLGLTEVLNLDGGGSSALWWKGALVTSPSGGTERPIPYAILFKAGLGDFLK